LKERGKASHPIDLIPTFSLVRRRSKGDPACNVHVIAGTPLRLARGTSPGLSSTQLRNHGQKKKCNNIPFQDVYILNPSTK
jgi:hypothetical protein